jgi:hypothetical protein
VYEGLSDEEDQLLPGNIVPKEEVKRLKLKENLLYTKAKSKASCDLAEIDGFTYGPISSRFWLLRQHINSMPATEINKGLPFYSWECITLYLKSGRQMNLVIQDEDAMILFIRFLILKLKSVNGWSNSIDQAIMSELDWVTIPEPKRRSRA